MEELVESFSLEGVTKKAVVVDKEKLLWTNKQHFKPKLRRPVERQQLAKELQNLLQGTSFK